MNIFAHFRKENGRKQHENREFKNLHSQFSGGVCPFLNQKWARLLTEDRGHKRTAFESGFTAKVLTAPRP